MEKSLISDEKYAEYLEDRDKALTKNQIKELRRIDRIDAILHSFENELGEEFSTSAYSSLRRQQIEILTNEKDTKLEKISEVIDDIEINLDIFNMK